MIVTRTGRIRPHAAVTLALCFAAASISAAPLGCDDYLTNSVVSNAGCQIGSTETDTLEPELQVNRDRLFGHDDWQFAERTGTDDQWIDLGLRRNGDVLAGKWSIDDVWPLYSDVLLVIVAGRANSDPSQYLAYRLVEGHTTGTYLSPYFSQDFEETAAIAHISAYVRSRAVPEPATWLLLMAGFLAARLTRRTAAIGR